MPKVLWCGDAVVKTGFEAVSNGFLRQLQARGWDVVHLGISALGDPHSYPWPLYPCWPGGDHLGAGRVADVIRVERPDVVVILNDAWIAPSYFGKIPSTLPIVVCPPVDALNQAHADRLNRAALVITPTEFGRDALRLGGYTGKTAVVGYGIDVAQYGRSFPQKAREALGMKEPLLSAFVVGNCNRNAPRKRLDLTMRVFADWIRNSEIDDAMLLLHCAVNDAWGLDLLQLVTYYGLKGRVIFTGSEDVDEYVPHEKLRLVYQAMDVQISTTVGEGFGMTTAEGMACGVPQIVPKYAALGEWAEGGVRYYGLSDMQVSMGRINTVQGIPNADELESALDGVYCNAGYRKRLADLAYAHISQPRFSWQAVGQQMHEALLGVINGEQSQIEAKAEVREKVLADTERAA